MALPPGHAAELPQAEGLLACLPGTPLWAVAIRGYSSHALREASRDLGVTPAIPTRKNEAQAMVNHGVWYQAAE